MTRLPRIRMNASILVAAALLLAGSPVSGGESSLPGAEAGVSMAELTIARQGEAGSTRRLDLTVERLWNENGLTHAALRIRNSASFELVKVTVRCMAFDANQRTIDTGERTVLAPGEQMMLPGALKTTSVALRAGDADVTAVSCEARAL